MNPPYRLPNVEILDALIAGAGLYWGRGESPELGEFVARMEIVGLTGRAVTYQYEAWREEDGITHVERGTVAHRHDGRLVVHVVVGDEPFALTLAERAPGVFDHVDLPPMRVAFEPHEGGLTYTWWWSPGDGLRLQSRAELLLQQRHPAPTMTPWG